MKALYPEEEGKAQEEGDSCQEEEEVDNSPSPSFVDVPGPHDGDGNPEGFF